MPHRHKIKNIHPKAEKTAKDAILLHRLADQALKKARKHHLNIPELWLDIKTLIRLVKAWGQKEYRVVPWKSLVAAVGALLYFLNPFDLIPDFLVFGFLDDALVISNILAAIKIDLDHFLAWEKETPKKHLSTSEASVLQFKDL